MLVRGVGIGAAHAQFGKYGRAKRRSQALCHQQRACHRGSLPASRFHQLHFCNAATALGPDRATEHRPLRRPPHGGCAAQPAPAAPLVGPRDARFAHRRRLGERRSETPTPTQVKGAWSPAEDELLLRAIEGHGTRKWSVLAAHLPGRTGKQCRERWHNQLNPDISKLPWTAAEDKVILRSYARCGARWADIAQALPGRTDNAVKNRWNCSMRRKIEQFVADEAGQGAVAPNVPGAATAALPLLLDDDRVDRAVAVIRKSAPPARSKRAAPSSSAPRKRPAALLRLQSWPSTASESTVMVEGHQPCYCRASKCLKLYCACFAAGKPCDGCNCQGCLNVDGGAQREAAVKATLARDPDAFASRKTKGRACACKRSRCLKRYCECFEAGQFCADDCVCLDCENTERGAVGRSQQARKPDAEVLRGASAMCFVRSSSPPPPPPSVTPPDGRSSSPRNVVEGAPKVPGLERIVSLERAASLHLDTLATLASKGSPLQPSVTPDTVAQHFSEPIAAERAVAV